MTKKEVFFLVLFSKESACHLGVHFRVDLCRLGGHLGVEVHFHGYRVFIE